MCRILRPADDEAAPHSLDKGSDFVSRRGAEAQAPLEEQRVCRILRPADDEAAPHSLDKGSDFVSRRGAEAQAPP